MSAVVDVTATNLQARDQPPAKVVRAAREFEAILLGSVLGSLEKTFASFPGKEQSVGADDYSYMATQALASSLAASGGIGIAKMIARDLSKTGGVVTEKT